MDLLHALDIAVTAAQEAGKILISWQERFTPREKGTNDFVTEADIAAQKIIEKTLLTAFPEHLFLGEEDTGNERLGNDIFHQPGAVWVVDPLDGTANYVHHLQTYAVSIALLIDGVASLGVVYDPISQECFTAVRNRGAHLNGKPIRVSGRSQLSQAMVAVSFSNVLDRNSPEIERFLDILLHSSSVRRLGSAALNLAYLAAGRLDAYYATSVKAWDIAAGVLLIQEAGGVITHFSGSPLDFTDPALLAAASPELYAEILPKMK